MEPINRFDSSKFKVLHGWLQYFRPIICNRSRLTGSTVSNRSWTLPRGKPTYALCASTSSYCKKVQVSYFLASQTNLLCFYTSRYGTDLYSITVQYRYYLLYLYLILVFIEFMWLRSTRSLVEACILLVDSVTQQSSVGKPIVLAKP